MKLRPWHLLLVAAALVVPLQAGALAPAPQGLTVSASLDHCGVAANGIVCKIDASWSGVKGADRYTSTVTLADGSVRSFGTVGSGAGGGATSLFVPYAGNGIYTITITAWGADPDGKDAEIEEAEIEAEIDKAEEKAPKPGKDKGEEEEPPEEAADEAAEDEGVVIDPAEGVFDEPTEEDSGASPSPPGADESAPAVPEAGAPEEPAEPPAAGAEKTEPVAPPTEGGAGAAVGAGPGA